MDPKKTIRIKFVDYWKGFDKSMESYLVMRILRKHYNVVVSEDADYVFYSVFGESHWKVPDSCVKIFHTGENLAPDFNACDYAIGFEWMDFEDRYIRFPLYLFLNGKILSSVEHKHELPSDWSLKEEKPDFCSYVVSNGINGFRNQMFNELSAYKRVDSGGRYMNNVGGPVPDKLAFESRHKFSICFENSSHSGYTTEKLLQAFAARTVPIYWGDPRVCETFNENAFINVGSYGSLSEVVDAVRELDGGDSKYLGMLKEPAFRRDVSGIAQEHERLERWLLNIFEQPLEEAYRRNRQFHGRVYVRRRFVLSYISMLRRMVNNTRRAFGRIFRQGRWK